jgi:hypothetical protein
MKQPGLDKRHPWFRRGSFRAGYEFKDVSALVLIPQASARDVWPAQTQLPNIVGDRLLARGRLRHEAIVLFPLK